MAIKQFFMIVNFFSLIELFGSLIRIHCLELTWLTMTTFNSAVEDGSLF